MLPLYTDIRPERSNDGTMACLTSSVVPRKWSGRNVAPHVGTRRNASERCDSILRKTTQSKSLASGTTSANGSPPRRKRHVPADETSRAQEGSGKVLRCASAHCRCVGDVGRWLHCLGEPASFAAHLHRDGAQDPERCSAGDPDCPRSRRPSTAVSLCGGRTGLADSQNLSLERREESVAIIRGASLHGSGKGAGRLNTDIFARERNLLRARCAADSGR